MKTIDKIRSTNVFCVSGYHAKNLGALANKYGNRLIAVAYLNDPDDSDNTYTIRLCDSRGIEDLVVQVWGNDVFVQESQEIINHARIRELLTQNKDA